MYHLNFAQYIPFHFYLIMTGPDHAWTGQRLVKSHSPSLLWLTKKFVTHNFFLCERCQDNLWFTNFRPYYLLTYIIIFATSCLSKFWFAETCSKKSNLISSEFRIHPVLPYLSPRGRSRSKLSKPSFRNLSMVFCRMITLIIWNTIRKINRNTLYRFLLGRLRFFLLLSKRTHDTIKTSILKFVSYANDTLQNH